MRTRTRRRSFEGYKPKDNPFDGSSMLETYGEQLGYVQAQAQKDITKVWTIVDVDGTLYVCAGFHFVNRFGYVITEESWENEDISFRWR